MNIVGLREAKSELTRVGEQAQRGRHALVTRRGRPFLVLLGVEGEDLIDVLIRWDPEFWHDIERRRRRSRKRSISLEEFEKRMEGPASPGKVAARRTRRRRRG